MLFHGSGFLWKHITITLYWDYISLLFPLSLCNCFINSSFYMSISPPPPIRSLCLSLCPSTFPRMSLIIFLPLSLACCAQPSGLRGMCFPVCLLS